MSDPSYLRLKTVLSQAPYQSHQLFQPPHLSLLQHLWNWLAPMQTWLTHSTVNLWPIGMSTSIWQAFHIPSHLYSACNKTVQNSLVNSHRNFLEMGKTTMLNAIEQVVTKSVNSPVHRMNFGNLMQHENEPIKDFLVRLRFMVVDCEFICPAYSFDLSNSNLKDQFFRGLQNETLQTGLSVKASQLTTIEDIVKHAEAFKTAVREESQLWQCKSWCRRRVV